MILLGDRTAVSDLEKRHRRTNRRTYFVEVILILGLILGNTLLVEFAFDQFGVSDMWIDIPMTLALLFLIGRAFLGRSHDLGRTDEWTLLLLAMFAGGWLVALFWTEAPFAVEALAHLTWVLAIVAPALIRGNEGENRYGSSPESAIELKVIANAG